MACFINLKKKKLLENFLTAFCLYFSFFSLAMDEKNSEVTKMV